VNEKKEKQRLEEMSNVMPKTREELVKENKRLFIGLVLVIFFLGVSIGIFILDFFLLSHAKESNEFCFPKEEIEEICVRNCNELDAIYIRFNQTVNLCECIQIQIHNKMIDREIIRTGVLK